MKSYAQNFRRAQRRALNSVARLSDRGQPHYNVLANLISIAIWVLIYYAVIKVLWLHDLPTF
jgi:hypothetical protein